MGTLTLATTVTTIMLLFLGSLSFLFNFAVSKICWRLCDESDKTQNIIQSLDISGCNRRSSYPEYEDFWCDGDTGPPCTGLTGDTLSIEIEMNNPGFTNLTQSASYLATSFLSFPWVGMDTNGCNYLDGGHGCMDPKSLDISGCNRRSSYPEYEDFWCDGDTGPPFTGLTGDTLNIEIEM